MVARVFGSAARVENLEKMSSGASRQSWAFDVVNGAERLELVLRQDPPDAGESELDRLFNIGRAEEYQLIETVRRHGVITPEPLFALEPEDGLGQGFAMRRIKGESIPQRAFKDAAYDHAHSLMAAQCGDVLARIHSVGRDELPPLRDRSLEPQLEFFVELLDIYGEPHPGFEYGVRWLSDNRPEATPGGPHLVHGDFRNGNFIIGSEGLEVVLDWELAHLGDPMEDIAWLCIPNWRYGRFDKPVGGFGQRAELFDAYQAAGGPAVDPEAALYWETFCTVRWGLICLFMSLDRFNDDGHSLERAAIGRRAAELEYDFFEMTG